jgi:hypothetical protein
LKAGLTAYERHDFENAIQELSPVVAGGETGPDYREAVPALGLSFYFRNDYRKSDSVPSESQGLDSAQL